MISVGPVNGSAAGFFMLMFSAQSAFKKIQELLNLIIRLLKQLKALKRRVFN